MEIVEIPHFTTRVGDYLTDNEYAALQWFLVLHPDAGDVVAGTGGARKIRWARSYRGKRGGMRVAYYHHAMEDQIWMLTLYAKNEKQDLNTDDKRVLKQIIEEIKQ